jgi:phage terminase Nu1 subunit (DNA packaging protein)
MNRPATAKHSLGDAARILGKKPDTLRKWFSLGCPHERKGKAYQLSVAEVFDWRIQHEKALVIGDDSGEVLVLEVERAKLTKEQRLAAEDARRIREGELIPGRESAERWSAMVLAARAKLLAMPDRIAARTSHPNPRKLAKELQAEIRGALNELADDSP